MITKDQIVQLMAERHNARGEPDPLEVVSWEPFTLRTPAGDWEGTDIPAGMILAKLILSQAK